MRVTLACLGVVVGLVSASYLGLVIYFMRAAR